MRPLLALALTTAVLLAGAAPAAAQSKYVYGLRAHAGWLSWVETRFDAQGQRTGEGRVLERAGSVFPFPPEISLVDLGPDPRGRAVGIYPDCTLKADLSPDDCAIRERRLAGGAVRTLFPRREDFTIIAAGQHRGTLALGQRLGTSGSRSRVLVRRAGEPRFKIVERDAPVSRIDVEARLMSYLEVDGNQTLVQVVDHRSRKLRPRTFAYDDSFEEDCRCASVQTDVVDATLDGRHVYWIERTVQSTTGSPLHGGGHATVRTRILRVDALARDPVVEEHAVSGNPSTLAVSGGRVFHDALEDMRAGGRPAWKRTALTLPVRS